MSFGLMLLSGSSVPPGTSLEMGIPSMTYRGVLLAFSEDPPLIFIVLDVPGAPPFELI
jgi:hypothetical protein